MSIRRQWWPVAKIWRLTPPYDSIGIRVAPASLHIKQLDGADTVINHENIKQLIDDKKVSPSLAIYRWGQGVVSHTFCSNCGSKLFIVGTLPEGMPDGLGGPFVSINLRALDISQHSHSLEDLSKPENLYYVDGANSFASQQGQPFPGGTW